MGKEVLLHSLCRLGQSETRSKIDGKCSDENGSRKASKSGRRRLSRLPQERGQYGDEDSKVDDLKRKTGNQDMVSGIGILALCF